MLSLRSKIVDKGFPEGFAKAFVGAFTPHLDKMEECDRLAVESFIPLILAISEEAWLTDPNMDLLLKVLDPSSVPQGDLNRDLGV